jgi:GT2 family glycosyltransferase
VISVSLVILTWNRWTSVSTSLATNLARAEYPVHEIIHVDNGSIPGFTERFRDRFHPAVQVLHKENQGVARGYNRGLAMASGSHVVITGCDRVLPDGWLKTWVKCFETVPETGAVACYTGPYEERMRGHPTNRGDLTIQRAIPVEARMHSRAFLHLVGYFREDFGLYGFEDAEWSDRAEKRAQENGLQNYIVHDMPKAVHLLDNDFEPLKPDAYAEWKKQIHPDPWNRALWIGCHQQNSPYYNPFSRHEPDQRERLKNFCMEDETK